MACYPVAATLRKGVVIKGMDEVTHEAIHYCDGVHQSLVVDKLRREETNVPGGRMNALEVASLKEITPNSAVRTDFQVRFSCNGLKLKHGFRSEPLICVNVENPGIKKLNVKQPQF